MNYETRFENLNKAQQAAVTTIDGPLMVIAGPGTGKTELLSMRAANILRTTDTLAENILCLTFTESGAQAMRERLVTIIGQDAYKIAVQTFHSFGSELINQHREYFYNGAQFQPASDVTLYEMMQSIFETLSHDNPLASTMNGEYTYLRDAMQVISELKRNSVTSSELRAVLDDNERILDETESAFSELFSNRISKTTIEQLRPLALSAAETKELTLPVGITPLANVLAINLSRAIDEAAAINSTKPITAWRNVWFEKNSLGNFVYRDRKRQQKLRALCYIYEQYSSQLLAASLYDFDDMILNVVHALSINQDLKLNLQEKYLYIMVDEFQDTNLAQNRLLTSLADNPVNEGAPNIMVVGDDDQAIYSFQGAEISNILQFKTTYPPTKLITLTENYRSTATILDGARGVISQGSDRLESYLPEVDKSLHANHRAASTTVSLHEMNTTSDERNWLVRSVKQQLDSGVPAHEIAVLARRHHELVALLPYFADATIAVNYERRENVLENEIVMQLELLARFIALLADSRHNDANALLPELLSHPAWGISSKELWQISLATYTNRTTWMEHLEASEAYAHLHGWFCDMAALSLHMSLEHMLDTLTGTASEESFTSPLYAYYFDNAATTEDPSQYLKLLGALRSIRDKLREHSLSNELLLTDMLEYIDLQRSLGNVIVDVTNKSQQSEHKVQLMTVHKSKGLEFDHVYIYGCIDNSWGEKVRSRSRLIGYPENLPFAPAGDSYDERLRLFYVAMTRARDTLSMSYSSNADNGSPALPARFLSGTFTPINETVTHSGEQVIAETRREWRTDLVATVDTSMKELLAPTLESYKLSATHLNTFLDVTRGGPQFFLVQNLLRFPQAMHPNAAYGSAVHRTLQLAHSHLLATGTKKPVEDLLHEFETALQSYRLSEHDHTIFSKRGIDYLQQFFDQRYESFSPSQQPELSFSSQHSIVGQAHLTGSLDLVDIDKQARTMSVVDYKTGKPSTSWKGKTDAEKIKLHKYRQQLLFYKLLVEHSRDFGNLTVDNAALQYVEPTVDGSIVSLELDIDNEELAQFSLLVQAVWQHITSFTLPDTNSYEQSYKGILAFEDDLRGSIDKSQ